VLYETRLVPEEIRDGIPEELQEQIRTFEPLPFDAGRGAVNWLRDHVDDPCGPWETVLIHDDDRDLLGFFALAYKRVRLVLDGPAETAMEVAWIARRIDTPKGFGTDLLKFAINIALSAGAVALLVSPHDDRTAEKVWINGFWFSPVPSVEPEEGMTRQVFLGISTPRG
jgi:hypothetical protein